MPLATLKTTLLTLSETIGDSFLNSRKPSTYIDPVLREMREEWVKVKQRIADNIVSSATEGVIYPIEEIFGLEDSLKDGLGTEPGLSIIPLVETILLLEAKKKLGQLGSGNVRNAKGDIEKIYFDRLGKTEWKEMRSTWSKIDYDNSFEQYLENPRYYKALVAKDGKGTVQGAMLYYKTEGDITIESLITKPSNIGKGKGYSGIGSDLLARGASEVDVGKRVDLLSSTGAEGFYEKIGMKDTGARAMGMKRYEFTDSEAKAFADKMGVSKTATPKIPAKLPKMTLAKSKKALTSQTRNIMMGYKGFTGNLIGNALKTAKSDTIPMLTTVGTGQGGFTTVKLSKEGFQQVVDSLEFQKNFVDDLSKDVVKRVSRIADKRYATKASLRRVVNREFRLDRDKGLKTFHNAVDRHAQRLMDGKISSEEFKKGMMRSVDTHYRGLYREGKGSAKLEAWENAFLREQIKTQEKYLDNFTTYIEQQKVLGNDLTKRVSQRAHLYAERGTAMFEAGHMASLPDDVLLDWVMNPAEHCKTCPLHAAGSPYTKETLPGLPGDGNSTECITNCRCSLLVSDLYVATPAALPEQDLAIKVTKIKPPPVVGTPNRTSENIIEYQDKIYKRVRLKNYYRYDVIDKKTAKVVDNLLSADLPDEVRSAFRKKWKPVTTKTVSKVIPKPKAPASKTIKTTPLQKPEEIIPEEIIQLHTRSYGFVAEYEGKFYSSAHIGGYKQYGIADKISSFNSKATTWNLVDTEDTPIAVRYLLQTKNTKKALGASKRATQAAAKYAPPADIRKQMGQLAEGRNQHIVRLNSQIDDLRLQVSELSEEFLHYDRMRKDPRWKELDKKINVLYKQIEEGNKGLKSEYRRLVQTSEKGFGIKTTAYAKTGRSGPGFDQFNDRAKGGVREFSKLIDADLSRAGKYHPINRGQGVIVHDMGKSGRAFAFGDEIHIATKESTKTVVHEMGHWLEHSVDDVEERAGAFLRKRTKNEKAMSLNKVQRTKGYDATEVTKKDKFIEAYMGKQYAGGSTELISMGVQLMYDDPLAFAQKDPEMFDWLYRVLRGMP